MLRITKSEDAGKTHFKLEGKLSGSWVEVLEQCWQQVVTELAATPVVVDISAVTYVDQRGTELLGQMHSGGAELRATTCLGKGIVEQIEARKGEPAPARH